MSHYFSSRRAGFSLVELCIVLVIAGLLAGAILGGRAVMKASELKSITEDIDFYIATIKRFEDKYDYLPGDMPNATSFWGKSTVNCNADPQPAGTPGTCNGNGNKRIASQSMPQENTEFFLLWQHLALGEMIQGQYTGVTGPGGVRHHVIGVNAPASKFPGGGFMLYYVSPRTAADPDYFPGNYSHAFLFGAQHPTGYSVNPILTQEEALEIDSKFDDGKPGLGKIMSYKSSTTVTPNCATTDVPATAIYNTSAATANTRLCNLIFLME